MKRLRNGVVAMAALSVAIVTLLSAPAQGETVNVKYRGVVDLKPFVCTDTKSSFVHRVCYDKANTYVVVLLNATWYHYCEIDAGTVSALIGATSVGRYYNANIKGTGKDGPFDCRTHKVPKY